MQASDGTQWSPWVSFTVTGGGDSPPVVRSYNLQTVAGQILPGTLISASDPDGDAITQYNFWETGNGGAQVLLNGTPQPDKQNVTVTAAQLAQTSYETGSGTDTAWVQAYDGTQWGPWAQLNSTSVDPAVVAAGATLDLFSAYSGPVVFAGSSGTLWLADPASFSGTVSGLAGQDGIDFPDISFTDVHQPSFSGTSSGGTLSVTDGTHSASIALLGNYLASTFVPASDGHGGTLVFDPPAASSQALSLAQPHA